MFAQGLILGIMMTVAVSFAARAQQPAVPPIPGPYNTAEKLAGWMQLHKGSGIANRYISNPWLRDRTVNAQISGINDPDCLNHSGTYRMWSGTSPINNHDYDPTCPQGRWEYLETPPTPEQLSHR